MNCPLFVVEEKVVEGVARSGFLLGGRRNVTLPFCFGFDLLSYIAVVAQFPWAMNRLQAFRLGDNGRQGSPVFSGAERRRKKLPSK